MRDQDFTKVEFLLKCNENIVVQRFFNVRGFNPKSKNSLDVHNYIGDLCRQLTYGMKMRTVVYMMDNQYEIQENPEILNTSNTDGEENFNLIIRVGDMTICHRQIDAKIYPPKVRYTVDVRPHLKNLLMNLTDIFSSKNLTKKYLDVTLSV